MKLYDYPTAPNPRRVRFFIAEKGLTIPIVTVDLAKHEQFAPTFRLLNPSCTVPVLELDDGTAISEVPVICRYLEELHPDPPLMGATREQRAIIGMWDRRMEIDGYLAAMEAVRNSLPGLSGRALVGPHGYAQIPSLPRAAVRGWPISWPIWTPGCAMYPMSRAMPSRSLTSPRSSRWISPVAD